MYGGMYLQAVSEDQGKKEVQDTAVRSLGVQALRCSLWVI